MTLRARTLCGVGVILALLFVTLFAGISALLSGAYSQLERELLVESLDRAAGALESRLEAMMTTARDWGHWDDTYRFVVDGNIAYVESNLGNATYGQLDVDLMLLVASSGEIRFAGGPIRDDSMDAAAQTAHLLPRLQKTLAAANNGQMDLVGGLLKIGGIPTMIAVSPILTSDGDGPGRGLLVIGRMMTEKRIEEIVRVTNLRMALLPISRGQQIGFALDGSDGFETVDGSIARAFRKLRGLDDEPVGIVRVESPRQVRSWALENQRYLAIGLIAMALGAMGALFVLLDHQILSRIQRFSRAVKQIRELPGDERRLPSAGRDELDDLAVTINSMLDSVSETSERLQFDALHDPLTALANRSLFLNRLEKAQRTVERNPLEQFAVLLVDLDDFKRVNDGSGHATGDHLLTTMAQRMEACVRAADTVARVGGDEFGILLSPVADGTDATRLAERILDELRQPLAWNGQEIRTTASIGISLCVSPDVASEALLREADIAMYRAKQEGKNRCKLFDEQMAAEANARLQLEAQIRRAIGRCEFRVHYQPIVDLEGGSFCGLEALIRWKHPDHGLLVPARFLSAAEDAGLIGDLDRWVVSEACRFLAEIRDRGPDPLPLGVCVNLSSRHLPLAGLDEHVIECLAANGLSPEALRLDVTENALLNPSSAFGEMLLKLRSHGIRLNLDDFGAGVSSLNHLQDTPVEMLKLDCSLVGRMGEGSDEVVRAVVELAHALNIGVVAEGVENARQLKSLKAMGCEYGQGRLFSEPLPTSRVLEVLLRRGFWRDLVADAS